jgi:hypothetical protein
MCPSRRGARPKLATTRIPAWARWPELVRRSDTVTRSRGAWLQISVINDEIEKQKIDSRARLAILSSRWC